MGSARSLGSKAGISAAPKPSQRSPWARTVSTRVFGGKRSMVSMASDGRITSMVRSSLAGKSPRASMIRLAGVPAGRQGPASGTRRSTVSVWRSSRSPHALRRSNKATARRITRYASS